jgi:hypothetical protein
MHRSALTTLAALAVMSVLPLSPAQAQSADDHPIIGVWKLNPARSSFRPGPGPQALTRQFRMDDDGYVVSVRATITPNGTPDFALARVKFDGQDYPVWATGAVYTHVSGGDVSQGSAAFEAVDGRTLQLTQKNPQGEVGPLGVTTWEVSGNGSTLTVTIAGTAADGTEVHNVQVYDRVESPN